MTLCGPSLEDAFGAKEIVVFPFRKENVRYNSVDLTLGIWAYYAKESSLPFIMGQHAPVESVWKGPFMAKKVADISKESTRQACVNANLRPHDMVMILGPKQTILASTKEFAGSMVTDIQPMIFPRAGYERSFLRVAPCVGTPGYFNRWVLRITNEHPKNDLIIVAGMPIAQMMFFSVNNVRGSPTYGSNKERDKYNPSYGDLAATLKTWKPELMLPMFYTDPVIPDLVQTTERVPYPDPKVRRQQQQQYYYAPTQQQPQPQQQRQVYQQQQQPQQVYQQQQQPQQAYQQQGYYQPPIARQPPPPQQHQGGYTQSPYPTGAPVQYVPPTGYQPYREPPKRPDGKYVLPPQLQPMHVDKSTLPPVQAPQQYDPTPPW